MRLKSLVLKGFKSFADETEINFNENLIGIVGPNGSGKSNIVDAIRWVLGEQKTSELRLEAMSDVLFNGTDLRKAGRVARVTLKFDNTKHVLPVEYTEVSISRILYRNGTSEYRLNDVPCRKKDITSLFIDSGIGSNSYAIISLNMVEDILHDSGGSRRHMLEQAAGISKYKIRKKETLSKLRITAEDLDRIEDLLFEIQQNMKAFEKQARRTEKFNKLKEKYRELSVQLAANQSTEIVKRLGDLRLELRSRGDEKTKDVADLAKAEAKLQSLKKDILDQERTLSSDQRQFNTVIEALGKAESQKNLTLQSIDTTTDRRDRLGRDIQNAQKAIEAGRKKASDLGKQLGDLEQKLIQSEQKANSASQEFEKSSSTYERLRQREKQFASDLLEKETARDRINEEKHSLQTRIAIFTEDIQAISSRLAQLDKNASEKEQELNRILAQKNDLERTLSDKEEEWEGAQKMYKNTLDDHQALLNNSSKKELELRETGQRIEFYEDISKKNEGRPESVKFVLGNEKDLGVFADLIHVQDEKHRPVIELFFEPYLHHLVLQDRDRAQQIYDSVRQNQKGAIRMLLPANSHPQNSPPPHAVPLIDLIEIDERYEDLLQSITSNVFLTEENMVDYDKKRIKNGQTLLFPNDFIIISEREVSGGSINLFQGEQLGRKKTIEKLKAKEEMLVQEIGVLSKQIERSEKACSDAKTKLAAGESAVTISRTALVQEEKDLFEIQKIHSLKTEESDRLKAELLAKSSSIESLKNEVGLVEDRLKSMESIGQVEDEEGSLSTKIDDSFRELTRAGASKDEHQSIFYSLKNQFEVLSKELEFERTNAEQLESKSGSLGQEKEILDGKLRDLNVLLEKVKQSLLELYQEKESVQKKLNAYEDTYYKEKGKIFEWEKKITGYRGSISSMESKLAILRDKIASQEFELKGLEDRIRIEFGLDLREVEIIESFILSIDEAHLQKEKLMAKIQSYGEINPMAITAYNEIKERHVHISGERDDILQAKKSLEETIQEIETTASDHFNEAIENVRSNFKSVFQSLFSEDDDCDIVLLNPNEPLESAIEIVAKPKGKRPKSINLLSGGEKALTAASFLFALYLLKPAPFCIFDEVDAPLDDVNVQKFNRLIREFSADSQFVIITHNKLTMAEVDVLYGVFLKEKGISGVSAVDFREYEAAEVLEPMA